MQGRERQMSSLDLNAHTHEGTTHMCAIHRGAGDETPLQLISAQELARLQQIEAAYLAMQERKNVTM